MQRVLTSPNHPQGLLNPLSISWMGTGATSSGVKWPEREADNSLLSSYEGHEWVEWSYTFIPPIRLHGMNAIALPHSSLHFLVSVD